MSCKLILISALVALVPSFLEAEALFTKPRDFADIGLAMPMLAGARGFVADLPRAEAYLISGADGKSTLEDRYDVVDLWLADTVRGVWRDDAGNVLTVARLDCQVPVQESGSDMTRRAWARLASKRALAVKDGDARGQAVYLVAPAETSSPEKPRRAQRRNLLALLEYPTTNENVRVVAFRPRCTDRKATPPWFVASLEVASAEDLDASLKNFDEDFLDHVEAISNFPEEKKPADEKELLFQAVRRNVVNYRTWHVASSDDVIVVDDLREQDRVPFINTLTNDLPRLRRAYAKSLPSPLAEAVYPAVVRVYDARTDYLEHVGSDYEWTAAVWSPERRELVLCLPQTGVTEMLATARHESLHQYLDYAAAMIQSSPWINEGHAELFRLSHFDSRGEIVWDLPQEDRLFIQNNVETLVDALPTILLQDYDRFYAGTQDERRIKYRLVWSVAYFLEVGAPQVRFQPFRNLRSDYLKALVRTRDRQEANRTVLTSQMMELLVSEWRAFWKRM